MQMPRTKKTKLESIKDMTTIGIIVVYLVQKLRKPTLEEIQEAIRDKLEARIHPSKVERALEGAKSAGFISINQTTDEDGTQRRVYSMKNLSWANAPEMAHVGDLLPKLLATEEAETVKAWFDGQEGEGAKKKKRGPLYDDYIIVEIDVVTVDEIIGSQGASEDQDVVRRQFPNRLQEGVKDEDGKMKPIEIKMWFMRDPLDGRYIIPQDVINKWFSTNCLRYLGVAAAGSEYIAFSPVKFHPHVPPVQKTLPVNQGGKSAAPVPYECILPGQKLTFRMLFPAKGLITIEQLEALFLVAGQRPRRGISPARGRRYGRFLVTAFRNLGPLIDHDLSWLEADVPPSIMEEHGDYFQKAIRRLRLSGVDAALKNGDVENGDDDGDD